MSAWFHNGKAWARTKMARWTSDDLAILCCPGPSLSSLNIRQGPGRTVAAINTAYPTVRPDMWFGMDNPDCYDARLWHEAFPKFCRGNYNERRDVFGPINRKPNTFFLDVEKGATSDIFRRRDDEAKMVWQWHTLGVAIHTLIWMGYGRIYLAGCDMGGATDYCHGTVLSDEQRERNRRLYGKQVAWLKEVSELGLAHGIRFASLTPNSPINEFLPQLDAEVVQRSCEDIPERPVRHCIDSSRKVTVATVLKSGGPYTPEYVTRLKAAVEARMENIEFVCLTDMPKRPGMEGIKTRRLRKNLPGWWSKMELFDQLEGPVIYFDLDTVFNGDLNWMKGFQGLTMLEDLGRPGTLATGVMAWEGSMRWVWKQFDKDRKAPGFFARWNNPTVPAKNGDGGYLGSVLSDCRFWQQDWPREIASFKFGSPNDRNEASIVCYHGSPRPHETNWSVHPEPAHA